jgi:hypothetical protein
MLMWVLAVVQLWFVERYVSTKRLLGSLKPGRQSSGLAPAPKTDSRQGPCDARRAHGLLVVCPKTLAGSVLGPRRVICYGE